MQWARFGNATFEVAIRLPPVAPQIHIALSGAASGDAGGPGVVGQRDPWAADWADLFPGWLGNWGRWNDGGWRRGPPRLEPQVTKPNNGKYRQRSRNGQNLPESIRVLLPGRQAPWLCPRRFHLRLFRTSLKDGQILPFRDADENGLVFALVGEMVLQLHPQYAGLRTNNIVFVRVVARRAAVYVNRNLRFGGLFRLVLSSTTAYVEKERPKPRGLFKCDAGGDATNQFLPLPRSVGRGLFRMHHRYNFQTHSRCSDVFKLPVLHC